MRNQCLWRPLDHTSNGYKIQLQTQDEEERDFHKIRHTPIDKILESDGPESPLTIIVPPRRSLVEIINSSIVVAQEVALAVFLLAVHRVIVEEETIRGAGKHRNIARETLLDVEHLGRESAIAMMLIYATLLVIVYYNQKALNFQTTQTGQRRKKAMVRMTDAILLAAMLRLTSGIIHTLTASYSSDTVYALSVSGMIIHLLTCDYKYANGISGEADSSSSHTSAHPRPTFLGGTVSLNAVFFSTALLVSRIESNPSSYAFVSLAVTLFAFYPATRHNIAGRYPNTLCSPCLIITLTLSISVWLITTSSEKMIFLFIQWSVIILSPCIQFDLQKHKKHISGRWDIAHISAAKIHKSKIC